MLDELHKARPRDWEPFGGHWIGPDRFEPWSPTLVARYDSGSDDDGQPVEVFCTAAPARFFTIKVLPAPNSIGEHQEGWSLRTGSSMAELAAQIADAISTGMLGLDGAKKGVNGTEAPHIPAEIAVEKCPCGHPGCRDYHLNGLGKFVQGSGFDRSEAQVVASLPDLYRALEASNKWMIAERDSLYACITDAEGNIPDDDDGAYLRNLDKLIDANQAAFAKTLCGS